MNKSRFIISTIVSVYFIYYCFTPMTWHFIDNVNLIFHEAGHVIFMFFGEFMHIIGGSLFQVLFPCLFVYYFYHKQDYFSASLLLFWVGQNLINVSVYIKDAVVMQLPLLGGDNAGHDWHNLLDMTGKLHYTQAIGSSVYAVGVIIIFIAIALSFSNTKTTLV